MSDREFRGEGAGMPSANYAAEIGRQMCETQDAMDRIAAAITQLVTITEERMVPTTEAMAHSVDEVEPSLREIAQASALIAGFREVQTQEMQRLAEVVSRLAAVVERLEQKLGGE